MLFKENKLSLFSRGLIYTGLLYIGASATINIFQQTVVSPDFFPVVLSGFILFLTAKIQVLVKGPLFSFGSRAMTTRTANIYRSGYWLMGLGICLTFSGIL
ncbi:MAG TPA: hypothetical protein ENJ08_14100 [Gammaproteobacteria bacterium]|nr:hypothetical protein [Gammaproteobacteria bacterium]